MTFFLCCITLISMPDSLLKEHVYWRYIDRNKAIEFNDVEVLLNAGVFHHINQYRVENSKHALTWNDQLNKAARLHNIEMKKHHFFAHKNPKNKALKGVRNRLEKVSADYTTFGENIAFFDEPITYDEKLNAEQVQTWAIDIFNQWKNSKGHRENMLRDAFLQSGISCYISMENTNKKSRVVIHATNVFTD